ncbi:MAG: transglycosylase SLT domain-containing protein [Desulfobacterales bacterium]
MRIRCIIAGLFVMVVFLSPHPVDAFDRYNRVTKYDAYFSKYSKRYFGPNFDWHHFKAQAIAESRLKATATSRVGAVGVMQIMPKTFEEIVQKHPIIKGTREQPRWNIAAGIYYDRKLWKLWKAERPFQDRLDFMMGSYNAGSRNILRAQEIAKEGGLNPNLWKSIEPSLPRITGKRSKETIDYIKRINIIKEVLR